jgi:cytochrome c oxidase accessory protein FixG
VWVDLFLVVERAIEGDRNARIKLENASWGLEKLFKRASKHGIWLLIGVATGGAWVFYFADAPALLADLVSLQAPAVAYTTIAVLTATTYTFGGLMREQVCTYMCPWPRIQAAMLDEHSLTVTYNDWRGEPRSRHAKKALAAGKAVGDCVDCNACVVVCPMGIDIREGQQLECITCALCIDACDDVMGKLGRDRGLISYATLADYNANMALATGSSGRIEPARVRDTGGKLRDGFLHTTWRSIVRIRTLIYVVIFAAIGFGMLMALALRSPLDLNVLHDRNPLYVELRDGTVRNGYDVRVLNMTPEPRSVRLRLEGLPGATMTTAAGGAEGSTTMSLELEPDKVLPLRLYVRADPAQLSSPHSTFKMIVETVDGTDVVVTSDAKFEAPER